VSVGVYVELAITVVPDPLDGVMVTWQLLVVAFTLARVQGLPEIVTVAVPVFVTATVPAGAEAVPASEVSLTKVVQVVACPVLTTEGEQVTAVIVVLRETVTVLPAVGPLPL
jgi:hypothetical protein